MKNRKDIRTCQPETGVRVDSSWWQKSLDLLLPPRCILCEQECGPVCLCQPCRLDLPWTGLHCHHCGLPLTVAEDDICGVCIQKLPEFTYTICPLQYEFPVDRLVRSFKFNRQLAAGRVLSHLLCAYVIDHDIPRPELLIPVPLHYLRMFRRGFNQAWELGNHVSKTLGIPLLGTSLRRRKNTAAQSGLSRKQRRKNVRGAFYWHARQPSGCHVALIDDVMTTGTTVNECARVLKNAGIKQVDVWVTARSIPRIN